MINYLKILAFLIFTSVSSNNSDILKITTSGSGETKELAVQEALRSALEQSYGTFISTKTNIKNDELIDDEIVSITNGDIHKYEIISEVSLSNSYEVVVQSQISLNQINNFKSQIGEDKISFDGKLFGVKRKLQKINQDAERISLKNLIETLDALYKNSIDFKMKDYTMPQQNDDGKFGITFTVSINYNENYEKFLMHFLKSLKSIAMNSIENKSFTNLNIKTYPIVLGENTFYFRNEDSYVILSDLFYGLVEKYYSFEVLTDTGVKLLSPSRCYSTTIRNYGGDSRKKYRANCNEISQMNFVNSFTTPFIELTRIVKLDISQEEFEFLGKYEKRNYENSMMGSTVVTDPNDKVMYWRRNETSLSGVHLDLYSHRVDIKSKNIFWAGTRYYRYTSRGQFPQKITTYNDLKNNNLSLFIREPFINFIPNYKNEKKIMVIGAKDIVDSEYRKELKASFSDEVSNIQLNYFGGIDGNENYYPKIDGKRINFNNNNIIYNPEFRFVGSGGYFRNKEIFNVNYSKIKSSLSNSKFKKFKKIYDEIKIDMTASLENYNSYMKSDIKNIMRSMDNLFKNEISFTHYFDESTLERVSDFKVVNMLTK